MSIRTMRSCSALAVRKSPPFWRAEGRRFPERERVHQIESRRHSTLGLTPMVFYTMVISHLPLIMGQSMGFDETINRKLQLVGGFKHFLFFHILGMSPSQLTKSYFSEG